jgi:hypothetical protein
VAGPTLIVPQQALTVLPAGLREDLLDEFAKILKNYSEGRWEPAELNGGKFAEAAYAVCRGYVDGSYRARAKKPREMLRACQALEQVPAADAPRSIRIQIPRMLVALYDIRNNRNVGHVGGDVDPNHMDATSVLQMAKWVVAELIRVLHQMPIEDAAELVEALVERETPLVWKIGDKKRVLEPGMRIRDKTLLLLHSTPGEVAESDIRSWVEAKNSTEYRRDILGRLHTEKLVEYDAATRTVIISPTGVRYVEEELIGKPPDE